MRIEIGKRLKDLRGMQGLTQKDLASRVSGGLDYTYIGKIERGEQLPSLKILAALSDALDVPIEYFFSANSPAADHFAADPHPLFAMDKGRMLGRALRLLHPDDLPLIVEIIKVLHRHRTGYRAVERAEGELLRAAEAQEEYKSSGQD